ncbi:MAG: carbohydrate ABC transporter permease [Rhizobiaceae bacterium]|nr:carbohydrate ABC transporter permease [Rhizobiaceae bacterium]MBO6727592.1 carbohydrate ABC transporter permease [Rhizobiaceae bacterium]
MARKPGETIWSDAGRWLMITLSLVFVLFPIVWLTVASLKTRNAALAVPPELIFTPDFDAYSRIFSGGFLGAFQNSLIIALTNVFLTLLLGVPAAYALTRMRGKVQENLSFWLLSIRMAPLFAVILPLYVLFKSLGLLDTPLAVSMAHLTLTLPLAVWMLVTYFRTIPEDLDQAALLDGANSLQILWLVIIPIARPMLASVAILVFIYSWNEFLLAFILTSRNAQTVPVAVASLAGTMSFDWPLIAAVSVVSMLPALVFVGFAQRHIVSGLGSGAVK